MTTILEISMPVPVAQSQKDCPVVADAAGIGIEVSLTSDDYDHLHRDHHAGT